jgi:hypothetical protein
MECDGVGYFQFPAKARLMRAAAFIVSHFLCASAEGWKLKISLLF